MRDDRIDIVRCVANYMIVCLHAWAAFQYVERTGAEFVIWTAICTQLLWMSLPTLFLMSGYLLFSGYSISNLPNKITRRVKRLFVPYLAWNIFFAIFYVVLAKTMPSFSARVASFGLDSISGIVTKVFGFSSVPIDGPLWYLRLVFALTLVSPIIWIILKAYQGCVALVLCAAWCVVEASLGLSDRLHIIAPAYAIACFVVGGVLSMHRKNLTGVFRCPWWLVVGVIACALRGSIKIPHMLVDAPVNAFGNTLISFLSILEAPVLLCLVSHFDVQRITSSRVYQILNGMSFFAYAGHKLFCSIWLYALAPLIGGWWCGKFTVLIIIFVTLGIATMLGVYYAGRKIFPNAMKVLDGTL